MSILERLFGKKDKKETTDNGNKTDGSVVKKEINRQDIRDAMLGKNGKMTVLGVAIDTITMCEIPMGGTSANLFTVRGIATSIEYFISSRYGRMPTKYISANLMTLSVGEKNVNIGKDNSLPVINEGDDVEAMCTPTSSGDVLDAWVLKNHTSGLLWCFSRRKASLGF